MQLTSCERARGRRRAPASGGARGFSLVELLVVLLVVGLLLGTILTPLVTQLEVREAREAERELDRIRDALVGFAQTKGRLPCPDLSSPPDGTEDTCSGIGAPIGTLPWGDLGVSPGDRWGRVYTYAVVREFTFASLPGSPAPVTSQLDLLDVGSITVRGERDDGKNAVTVTTTAAAVVVSHGSNGHCATRVDGSTLAGPDDGSWGCGGLGTATVADEYENVDDDTTFVARPRSAGGSGCDDAAASSGPLCAFDDLLVWLPGAVVLSKMVEARQLP